jgi:hypothetical protein
MLNFPYLLVSFATFLSIYSKMDLGSSVCFARYLWMLGEFKSPTPRLSVDLEFDMESSIPGACSFLAPLGS